MAAARVTRVGVAGVAGAAGEKQKHVEKGSTNFIVETLLRVFPAMAFFNQFFSARESARATGTERTRISTTCKS